MCSYLDGDHGSVFSLKLEGLSVVLWRLLRFVELVEFSYSLVLLLENKFSGFY